MFDKNKVSIDEISSEPDDCGRQARAMTVKDWLRRYQLSIQFSHRNTPLQEISLDPERDSAVLNIFVGFLQNYCTCVPIMHEYRQQSGHQSFKFQKPRNDYLNNAVININLPMF